MQALPPSRPHEETEEPHEFESRFSFPHELPSPLPRVVTAFVCSPWSAVPECRTKKRRAPLPPSIEYMKGVKNSALYASGVYDMISIHALAHNWLPPAHNPPRLLTFAQEEGRRTQEASVESSTSVTKCENAPKIYMKLAPRTSKAKEESLKARKNKSHSSIIRRKTEAASSGSLREKIPRDPTYEEIDDYFDHNHNVNELAEIVVEKLDSLLNKPIVSESCASSTKNRQRQVKSLREKKNSSDSRRGTKDSRKGKGGDEASTKENVKSDDCAHDASGEHLDTSRRPSKNKHPLGERVSGKGKGSMKTYIFGGSSSDDSGKRQRALKERQSHLAAPCQPPSNGRKNAEDCRTNSTEKKKLKAAVASPSVKISFKTSARRYKDTVFHTYKKRHKGSKGDTLTGKGRQLFHQIPRVVMTCENWLTDYEKNNAVRSRSLGKLRASFRKLPMINHASDATGRPRCAEDTSSSQDHVEGERRKTRPHSSCDYVRPTSPKSPERGNASQPQPRTPNRDSPSLSDDMYVRRKSRSRREDLAKMR